MATVQVGGAKVTVLKSHADVLRKIWNLVGAGDAFTYSQHDRSNDRLYNNMCSAGLVTRQLVHIPVSATGGYLAKWSLALTVHGAAVCTELFGAHPVAPTSTTASTSTDSAADAGTGTDNGTDGKESVTAPAFEDGVISPSQFIDEDYFAKIKRGECRVSVHGMQVINVDRHDGGFLYEWQPFNEDDYDPYETFDDDEAPMLMVVWSPDFLATTAIGVPGADDAGTGRIYRVNVDVASDTPCLPGRSLADRLFDPRLQTVAGYESDQVAGLEKLVGDLLNGENTVYDIASIMHKTLRDGYGDRSYTFLVDLLDVIRRMSAEWAASVATVSTSTTTYTVVDQEQEQE